MPDNIWDEMSRAVSESRATLRAADSVATDMAHLLIGRLDKVKSTHVLSELKRELRKFDITKQRWK